MIVNQHSGTSVDEVAEGIFRISTPVPPEVFPAGFSFNQFLVADEAPVLFHTGPRAMFDLVRDAIAKVLPVSRLRYIGLSHVEADELGSLNQFLALAPEAAPLCGRVAAMVSVNDIADRPARALANGEELRIGARTLSWLDAPHVPHNWEAGYLFDQKTRTLLCGDIFTQGGHRCPPVVTADLLEPSEAFRHAGVEAGMPDYFSAGPGTRAALERLATTNPTTLACMHGSSWRGSAETARKMFAELEERVTGNSGR